MLIALAILQAQKGQKVAVRLADAVLLHIAFMATQPPPAFCLYGLTARAVLHLL